MNRIILVCVGLCMATMGNTQEAELKKLVNEFFQSMYRRDTAALRKDFIPAAMLYTYSYDSKGNPRAKGETVNDFLRGVSLIGEAQMEERLTDWQCLVDEGVASIWAPYEFYFEGKFTHCGIDNFQVILVQGSWKISQLTDTRRKKDCVDQEFNRFVVDSLVNAWHHAASVADANAFFGFMTKDAIYIGTDATERWKRDELREWSKKYFERESAWDFKPISRTIEFAPGGKTAWFDELLDTAMGTCRSSGVLEQVEGQWKLVHYQLSLTLPNDKIGDFKKLIGKE